jgi:hypothetical protein
LANAWLLIIHLAPRGFDRRAPLLERAPPGVRGRARSRRDPRRLAFGGGL